MPDFNPIAEAKRIMQEVRDRKPAPREFLCDYIDALVVALRETDRLLEVAEDECASRDLRVEKRLHDNRHLLEG
jgi:hypothetical protein